MSSSRLAGIALAAVVAALAGSTSGASAAVSNRQAADRAVRALGVRATDAPVIVFRSGAALRGGTVVTQAGESSAPSGKPTKIGVVTTTPAPLLRVPKGRGAYLFYADLAPYQAYAHRGRLALVDIASGKVRLSKTLTSPPVIDGRLPFFMRSGEAYGDPKNHVFATPYKVTTAAAAALRRQSAFGYRVDRAPLADLALARRAAGQLAADHACVLRVSDTFGEFYDFTGADHTRARLGDLFYVLAQLNPGFIDQRYTRSSGDSPAQALERLITEKGCKDVLLYVAGRGYSKGPGTTLGIGTRVEGARVRQQLLKARAVESLARAHPDVVFSLKVDAPFSKGFVQRVAGLPNVAIAEAAAGASGASFGFLPEVYVDGKAVANTSNPDGLLEFTNRSLRGIERFLTSAPEVEGAVQARASGAAPSFLAIMLGRAFSLGQGDDLPSLTGIQKPFFAPTKINPGGPPPPPVAIKGIDAQPAASPGSATTAEDTPVAIVLGGVDPSGQPPEFAIETAPSHGTLTGTGASRTYTPAENFSGTDSFVFSVRRRGGGASLGNTATATFTITVSPVDDAPVITTSTGSPTFTEGGPSVVVDPAIAIQDVDSSVVTGATATITAGVSADDELLFTAQNGITGSYTPASGVLTMTGDATLSQYETALRSIAFRITGANPAGGSRRVAFRVTTNGLQSAEATRQVAVAVINDAPVLSIAPSAVAYTENDPGTAVGAGAAIADPDSPTMTSATVSVTANFDGTQDRLEFDATPSIAGSFDATTGVLSLAGTAPRSDYEAALAAVRYRNLSNDPSTAMRTLSFRVNDGSASSNVVTRDVTVTTVNDAPVLTTSTGTATFAEQGTAVAVDPALTADDPDDATLGGAVVAITGGFQTGDLLAFTDTVAITGTYAPATGVLTLTGSATKAAYESALRSIAFSTPGDDPVAAPRTVSFTATDGDLTSAAVTRDVVVTPINDAPTVSVAGSAISYTENAAAVAIDPAATVTDVDDANLASATISISSGFQPGDELVFTDQSGITGTTPVSPGTLELAGSATKADYATALRDVRFRSTSDDPVAAARTITFVVRDATDSSTPDARDVTVVPVNDAPAVSTSSGTTPYTEGASPIAIDDALTVGDPDDTAVASATVTLGTGSQPGDLLGFTDGGGITGGFAGGVLTLTGTASLAQYQAALRSVTYSSSDTSVPTGTRVIEFRVSDGSLSSPAATKTIAWSAVNSAPVVTNSGGSTAYTEAASPVVIDAAITATDADDTNLKGAAVTISAGLESGDTLGFSNAGGITGTYDAPSGTLTLTGVASVAAYQSALRTVTFSSSSLALSDGSRTIAFAVTDPADVPSTPSTKTVNVTAVNNAPVLTLSGSTPSFTENGASQVVDSAIAIADPDSVSLASATVQITNAVAGDGIGITTMPPFGLNVTGTATSLSITGAGTLAEYEALLRSVAFFSTSENPTSATRTVRFIVTDSGAVASAAADKSVAVTAVNDAPVGNADPLTTDEDTVKVANVFANDTDAESDTLTAERIDGVPANVGSPVLLASGATVTLATNGQITYDPRGAFDDLQVGDPDATETVTYRAKDPSGDTTLDTTVTFTITPVNDAPIAPARAFNAVANADLELEKAGVTGSSNPKIRIDGDLLAGASDPDDAVNTIAVADQTVASSGGGAADIDADGTFVYVSDNGAAESSTDTFPFQVTDPHGGTRSIDVTVNLRERIWFVDPTPPAGGNEGTTANPFTTVAAAVAAASSNEPIYVAAGTISGSATLGSGQILTGEGVALTANLGGTGSPSGVQQLAAAGTRPVLTSATTRVLGLGGTNTIRGLNINPDTAADGIAGTSATTTTIANVAVTDTGTASSGDGIDITNGTVDLTDVDVTTNGSGAGLRLTSTTANAGGGSDVTAVGGPAVVTTTTVGGTLTLGSVSSTDSGSTGITLGGATNLTTTTTTIDNPSGTGLVTTGSGSFSASNAASKIVNSASTGLQASTGSGNVTFPGTIDPDANAPAVDVQGRLGSSTIALSGPITSTGTTVGINIASNSGGSVTFSGPSQSITAAGTTGVLLTANGGSTVNFTGGGLAVTTTNGTGIAATSGGSIAITGTGNTIASTTGTGLQVDSTSIGASDITFRSITASGAANGIMLRSTGSAGSLHVTGDATTTRNATGGTISSVTGADSTTAAGGNGIYLSDSDGATLEQMTVTGSAGHGVKVIGSDGFSFRHGTVTSNGNNEALPFAEGNVRLDGLTGTATLDDNTLSAPQTDNVDVVHDSGTGTYAVTNNAISMNLSRGGVQNDNVLLEGGLSGSLTATVDDNTFTGVGGDHVQVAQDDGNANWDVDVKRNTMTSADDATGEHLLGGITVSTANNTGGQLLYDVDGNDILGAKQGGAVRVFHGSTQSGAGLVLKGYIRNNDIGDAGTNQSGASESSGISLADVSTNTHTVLIENNTVDQWAQNGIVMDVGSTGVAPTLNATVRGNTVGPFATGTGITPSAGIHVNVGVGASQTGTSCIDVGGAGALANTVNAGGAGGGDIRIRQRQLTLVQLPGFAGSTDSAGLHAYLTGRNAFANPGTNASTTTGNIANTGGGAPCPQPTH